MSESVLWSDNTSWPGRLGGGLLGCLPHVIVERHNPMSCKPGMWFVALHCGNDVRRFLDIDISVDAVVDDFGTLVPVRQQ